MLFNNFFKFDCLSLHLYSQNNYGPRISYLLENDIAELADVPVPASENNELQQIVMDMNKLSETYQAQKIRNGSSSF